MCHVWKKRNDRLNDEDVPTGSRNGAPSCKGRVVTGHNTKTRNEWVRPPVPSLLFIKCVSSFLLAYFLRYYDVSSHSCILGRCLSYCLNVHKTPNQIGQWDWKTEAYKKRIPKKHNRLLIFYTNKSIVLVLTVVGIFYMICLTSCFY